MSDWEVEYDENGASSSKPLQVNTAPYTQWGATSNSGREHLSFCGKRGGKVDRERPQWRNWRERDSNNGTETRREKSASTRPLTMNLEKSLIGRIIGKLAVLTCATIIISINSNNKTVCKIEVVTKLASKLVWACASH